jgi:hypothetical protein
MTANLGIHGSTVQCPRRGAVDVEQCFLCPDLARIEDGGEGVVVCDAGVGGLVETIKAWSRSPHRRR